MHQKEHRKHGKRAKVAGANRLLVQPAGDSDCNILELARLVWASYLLSCLVCDAMCPGRREKKMPISTMPVLAEHRQLVSRLPSEPCGREQGWWMGVDGHRIRF